LGRGLSRIFPPGSPYSISERENLTITLDIRLLEQFNVLAIFEKRTPNRLLQEAFHDLLKKYEERWCKKLRRALWCFSTSDKNTEVH
jgi:hypothetical protein